MYMGRGLGQTSARHSSRRAHLPGAGWDLWGLSAAVAEGAPRSLGDEDVGVTFQAPARSQPSPKGRAGLPPSAVVCEELVERGARGGFVPARPLRFLGKGRW